MTAPDLTTRADEGAGREAGQRLNRELDAAYDEARSIADKAGIRWSDAKLIADIYYGPAVHHDVATINSLKESTAAHEARAAQAEAEVARLRERVAVLEGALKPFAKLGSLFGPRISEHFDVLIYGPAAGPEYNLTGDHLRAARTALEANHAEN